MDNILKNVSPDLIKNTSPLMYTEYPHKKFWSREFSGNDLKNALKVWQNRNAPVMLYVHIPFCEQLCWFCTCHTFITGNYQRVKKYLSCLYREIDLFRCFLRQNGISLNVKEIHLGGGSPTIVREKEFDEFMEKIGSIAEIKSLSEFSIEIDPRKVDRDRMRYYYHKGINRVSFGLQDFDPNVQKAVNRVQSPELVEKLLVPEIRELFQNGVSFDIICGLPLQTRDSIRKTFERIVEISPDRICLNFLHYAPESARHQKIMHDGRDDRPLRLPDMYERKDLFVEALGVLLKTGYVRTGYDHFAKPTDSVAKTMKNKTMHWSALGVTPGVCRDVIGLGVSSISTIGDCYVQNFYTISDYEESLKNGEFPVYRGHELSRDDVIRRDIIRNLRNFFFLDYGDIERNYGISFKDYFEEEISVLENFVKDGLVEVSNGAVEVTETGRQFANLVCWIFDAYKNT